MIFFSNALDMGPCAFAAALCAGALIQIEVARVDMPRFDLS
jgi:hypothetical protein